MNGDRVTERRGTDGREEDAEYRVEGSERQAEQGKGSRTHQKAKVRTSNKATCLISIQAAKTMVRSATHFYRNTARVK